MLVTEFPLRTEADLAPLRALGSRRFSLAATLLALQALEAGGGQMLVQDEDGQLQVEVSCTGAWTPDLDALRSLVPELQETATGSLILRGPALSVRAQAEEELRSVAEVDALQGELEQTNLGIMALHKDLDDAWQEMQLQNEALRVAEARALEASRLKSEFLASMSHDIRTPLNGVMGMAWLLLSTELTEEQREYAHTICTSAETLLALVSDILDLSRIEAGRIELESVPFDLLETVEEAVDVVAPDCHARGLELVLHFGAATPRRLEGDPTRLRQVLVNLLSNAVKFTPTGHVLLRVTSPAATAQRAHVRIEVQDTGIGIPAAALPVIFEKFTQADASTTRRYGGSGLGLAICKRLVDLMGGEIGVESEPGRGSAFWFEVDLARTAAGVPEAALPGPSILLVDALPFRRDALVEALEGLDVGVAASAAEALELQARRRFDLVVAETSLEVPGADVLLARDPAEARVLRRSGHRHVLSRPVRPSQLAGRLREIGSGERAASPSSSAPDLGLRVLLVEDNAINRRVAVRTLEKMGCQVDVAVDGREAVQKLVRDRGYDVALMDCHMPEMDGFEATRLARRRGVTLPILALTALATEKDRAHCVEAGMTDVLVKPVNPDALRAALEAAVQEAFRVPGES